MSDPIRSISQNNFILADQKEVSHDNTLTGNGTPESPLGVANSSDETVLWENASGSSSSITPSESLFNFEYAEFYVDAVSTNNTRIMPVRYRVKVISGVTYVAFGGAYFDGGNVRNASFGLSIGNTISFLSHSTSGYTNKIYKVVGIKRISNS